MPLSITPAAEALGPVIAPTLVNGWLNNGGGDIEAGYFKSPQRMVTLHAVLKSGVADTIAFTLPVGYRPASTVRVPAINVGTYVASVLMVNSAGEVTPRSGGFQGFYFSFRVA